MMNIQRGFSKIIGIIIGILVIGGGIYYFGFISQSKYNKIEYSTYTNDKYNFSIDYPKGYFLGISLNDHQIPPLENELLVTLNFRSHSFEETEDRYHNGLSQFPDDYKNINLKVFYTKNGYDFKFESSQVNYDESFELVIEHMRSSIVRNEDKNVSSTTEETFIKDKYKSFISEGDKIGNMIVTSIEPYNPDSNLSQNNIKLNLSGPITITGMYSFVLSESGFSGYCMSDFDEESFTKLPFSAPLISKSNFFCFRNEDFVKNKLGQNQEKIKVTVKIDNFEINRYPVEVVDRADLLEVIQFE